MESVASALLSASAACPLPSLGNGRLMGELAPAGRDVTTNVFLVGRTKRGRAVDGSEASAPPASGALLLLLLLLLSVVVRMRSSALSRGMLFNVAEPLLLLLLFPERFC